MDQTPEDFHFYNFRLRNGELYYKDMDMPLMTKKGMLKLVGDIACILGKKRLRKLGFFTTESKLMARQAIMLNRVK